MSKKRFSLSAWIASFGAALLGAFIMHPEIWKLDSSTERILWSGAFFLVVFLCGFIGMFLSLQLSRKYKVERPRNWLLSMLLACVLLFGVGAGGQALFMYSKEELTVPAEVDMVLLLDSSGSMHSNGYDGARTEAGCQFVESLNENHRLKAISFAAIIQEESQLLTMDFTGKEIMKQFIRGIDSTGMTNFNDPLNEAIRILEGQGREMCNRAVFLLTDGVSTVDQDVVNKYLNTDIMFFSIRIDKSATLSPDAQALADFANATGGFDSQLVPNADGSINTADLLNALQNAFRSTSETRVKMREDLLVSSEDTTLWQFGVRAVTLLLCAIIFAFGYFGQINLKTVLAHGAVGLILAVLISILGDGYGTCVIVLCLLMASAYVTLKLNVGDEIDV